MIISTSTTVQPKCVCSASLSRMILHTIRCFFFLRNESCGLPTSVYKYPDTRHPVSVLIRLTRLTVSPPDFLEELYHVQRFLCPTISRSLNFCIAGSFQCGLRRRGCLPLVGVHRPLGREFHLVATRKNTPALTFTKSFRHLHLLA